MVIRGLNPFLRNPVLSSEIYTKVSINYPGSKKKEPAMGQKEDSTLVKYNELVQSEVF